MATFALTTQDPETQEIRDEGGSTFTAVPVPFSAPAVPAAPGLSFIWTPTVPGQTGPVAFTDIHALLFAAIANGDEAASEMVIFAPPAALLTIPSSITVPPNMTWRTTKSGLEVTLQFGDGVHILGFMPAELDSVLLRSTKTAADLTPVFSTPGTGSIQQTIRIRGIGGGIAGSVAVTTVPFLFVQGGDTQFIFARESTFFGNLALVPQLGSTAVVFFDDFATMSGDGAIGNAGTLDLVYFGNSGVGETVLSVIGGAPTVQNFRALPRDPLLTNQASGGGPNPAVWAGIPITATARNPFVRFQATATEFDPNPEAVTLAILIDGVPVAQCSRFDNGGSQHRSLSFQTTQIPVTIGPHTVSLQWNPVGTVTTDANDFATLTWEH